jgi:hypothetical protein
MLFHSDKTFHSFNRDGSYEHFKISLQELRAFKNTIPRYYIISDINALTEGLRILLNISLVEKYFRQMNSFIHMFIFNIMSITASCNNGLHLKSG